MVDFTATITLLPVGQARKSPANNEYRTLIHIDGANHDCQMISHCDCFPLGEATIADVTLLSPEFVWKFRPDAQFQVREGNRVVGNGVVIQCDDPDPHEHPTWERCGNTTAMIHQTFEEYETAELDRRSRGDPILREYLRKRMRDHLLWRWLHDYHIPSAPTFVTTSGVEQSSIGMTKDDDS